jgi:hypothetical protein
MCKKNLPEALFTMPLAAAVALAAAVELYLTPRTVVLVAERRVERNILNMMMGEYDQKRSLRFSFCP